jgi:hypothetical protein
MDKRFINEHKVIREFNRLFRRLESTKCRFYFNRAKACSKYKEAYLYAPKLKSQNP